MQQGRPCQSGALGCPGFRAFWLVTFRSSDLGSLDAVCSRSWCEPRWCPSSDAAPERSRPPPVVLLRLPATEASLDLDVMTDAACSGRGSAGDTRWNAPCGPQRDLSFGIGIEADSLVKTGGYRGVAGNQADPIVGCRVQQTCTAHAEQAVEVVRNGMDGTGLGPWQARAEGAR